MFSFPSLHKNHFCEGHQQVLCCQNQPTFFVLTLLDFSATFNMADHPLLHETFLSLELHYTTTLLIFLLSCWVALSLLLAPPLAGHLNKMFLRVQSWAPLPIIHPFFPMALNIIYVLTITKFLFLARPLI